MLVLTAAWQLPPTPLLLLLGLCTLRGALLPWLHQLLLFPVRFRRRRKQLLVRRAALLKERHGRVADGAHG